MKNIYTYIYIYKHTNTNPYEYNYYTYWYPQALFTADQTCCRLLSCCVVVHDTHPPTAPEPKKKQSLAPDCWSVVLGDHEYFRTKQSNRHEK